MFKSNEVIPKAHGFIEGIKDLKISELEKINKNIIKKLKYKILLIKLKTE